MSNRFCNSCGVQIEKGVYCENCNNTLFADKIKRRKNIVFYGLIAIITLVYAFMLFIIFYSNINFYILNANSDSFYRLNNLLKLFFEFILCTSLYSIILHLFFRYKKSNQNKPE